MLEQRGPQYPCPESWSYQAVIKSNAGSTALLMGTARAVNLKQYKSSGTVCNGHPIHPEKALRAKRQRMIKQ